MLHIQALREAGDDPTPALLEAILAHGEAAVAPLREFLESGLPQGSAGAHDRPIPGPVQDAVGSGDPPAPRAEASAAS